MERKLHTTDPHGAQSIVLVEDAENPSNRIYVLRGDQGGEVDLTGTEIDNLLEWWREEQDRAPGEDE